MPWIQLKINTTSIHAESIENLLIAANSSAVTLQDSEDQPVYEPELGSTPLWSNTTVIGLFEANEDIDAVTAMLREQLKIDPFPHYKIEIVEDKDWEREWMTHFHPIRFGSKLWICPSWKEVPDPDAVNLMLDPGLAFGTGTHPTTALCLEWLERQKHLTGSTLIDYGCGSGILAIAALLLGADKVTAVDLDPQALEATISNAQRNNIAPERLAVYLPQLLPVMQTTFVIANILAAPLKNLAPTFAELANHNGHIALSGILKEQANELIDTYSPWFEFEQPIIRDDWVLLSGKRRETY